MWRYFEVLPVRDPANVVTLGEGYTPLLRADRLRREIGCGPLLIKDEGVNPTASFKARGMSAAVSKAKELGVKGLTVPTAGNAGRRARRLRRQGRHRGPRLHARRRS